MEIVGMCPRCEKKMNECDIMELYCKCGANYYLNASDIIDLYKETKKAHEALLEAVAKL